MLTEGTSVARNALHLQRESLLDELRAAQGRLFLIDRLLDQGEPSMSITVHRTTVPAMTVVALRGIVPTCADEGQLWDQILPALTAQAITPSGPCGVIEHDDQYTERDVDLSIFSPVAPGTRVEALWRSSSCPSAIASSRRCGARTTRSAKRTTSSTYASLRRN